MISFRDVSKTYDEGRVHAVRHVDLDVAANDLVVLEDHRSVFPPYDAVILLGASAAADRDLRAALHPIVGAIDDELMREANRQDDVAGVVLDDAARHLLDVIDRTSGVSGG